MSERYCITCLQSKDERHFSIWMEDKNKPVRCDHCHNLSVQKQRMCDHKAERAAKSPPVAPILKELAKTMVAKQKRNNNIKLYQINECKRLMDELGINKEEAQEIVEQGGL